MDRQPNIRLERTAKAGRSIRRYAYSLFMEAQNVRTEFIFAFVSVFVTVFALSPSAGQGNEPAQVFRPALAQVRGKTRVAILLPSKIPTGIREGDIKLASGRVSENGYFISLYYTETGVDAAFVAGFGASTQVFRSLPNTRAVKFTNGIVGMFRPVSCGGSCAPANLWWEQNGVMYQIQIKLPSTTNEQEQERILVDTANSLVTVPK